MSTTRSKESLCFSLWANKQWIKEYQNEVCIQQNFGGERENLCFEWEMAIQDKTFAIAILYTYIADRQGHVLKEKIHDWVKMMKTAKAFQKFCHLQYVQQNRDKIKPFMYVNLYEQQDYLFHQMACIWTQ